MKKQGTCKDDGTGVKIQGLTRVTSQSVAGLKTAVARGPTSVTLSASEPVFKNYESGVLNDASACKLNWDHGVIIVGYTSKYYLIKNSWGTTWGENGFGKIAINGDGYGVCGIQKSGYAPYTL